VSLNLSENFGGKDEARYRENHGIEKPVISIFYCISSV